MIKTIKSVMAVTLVLVSAFVVCVAILWFTIVQVQARNLNNANSIADLLAARFPLHRFAGGGGYEEPEIRITVVGPTEKTAQAEIGKAIAAEKNRRQLNSRIEIRFVDGKTGAEVAKSEL